MTNIAVAVAAAPSVMLTGGAAYAAPPTPTGCTFNQGTGQTTCVTTSTTSGTVGPVTASGGRDDGTPGSFACELNAGLPYYAVAGLVVATTTTTTTTTVYQGASPGNGKKLSTSTVTSPPHYIGMVSYDVLSCSDVPI